MLVCPICKCELNKIGNTYKCKNNHSYDISKDGYVNLLINNNSAGDNKEMVNARYDFLNKGYYERLAIVLNEAIGLYTRDSSIILDSGCGTGYYTSFINNGKVYGYDISNIAIKKAAKLNKNKTFFVASMADIPLQDNSVSLLYHIFSPLHAEENKRILKDKGIMIVVSPGEKHLIELKRTIYDNAYLNTVNVEEYDSFRLLEDIPLTYKVNVNKNDITNLVKMTPYFYKTKKEDLDKLNNIKELKLTIDFRICIYLLNK